MNAWQYSYAGDEADHLSDSYPRVASLKTAAAFRAHLERSRIPLAFDDELAAPAASPLAQPIDVDGVRVGNRFCILPMEGWDGTARRRADRPHAPALAQLRHQRREADLGRRSGRRPARRPRESESAADHAAARSRRSRRCARSCVASHRERFGPNADSDLYVGLQLTHSGRYARPNVYDPPEPLAGAPHPVLDRRFPNGVRVLKDAELDRLVDDFIAAARARARRRLPVRRRQSVSRLSRARAARRARPRAGRYGGSLENRTRFMRTVIEGIRAQRSRPRRSSSAFRRSTPSRIASALTASGSRTKPQAGRPSKPIVPGSVWSRTTPSSMRRWRNAARCSRCSSSSACAGSA